MHCLSRKPSSCLVNSYSDVKENNEWKKESYEATWLDFVMETRPEYKATVVEKDLLRKESYELKKVVHFVIRRFPNQTMRMGQESEQLCEYHLPYKKNVLPVPIFMPRNVALLNDFNQAPSPSELKSIMEFEKKSTSAICPDKRELSFITKDIPRIIQASRA